MHISKKKIFINIILYISIILFILIYLFQYYDYKKQNDVIEEGKVDYISIDKIKIKRILKKEFDMNLLNKGYVGYKYIGNNLLVAGHAIEQVFSKIDLLENGDIVLISIDGIETNYLVIDNYTASISDFDLYEYDNIMFLITCDLNKYKRKIVVTKKLT